MNRFVKLFCLLGLLLYPASYALAWCSGGCTCCRCPGEAQCLGSHSSCEAACGLVSEPSRGGSAPSYDYGAAQRAQEAAAAAEAERQRQQAESERIERERRAEEKRQKDAAFIRDRDAAANTLKGSTGSAMGQLKGLAGADSSGLKGSGFDSGSELKGLRGSDHANQKASSKPVPHTDTSVVDARNVPSGLPKGLDNAIASAYSSAPPGVSDRVRKGFQAVMERDWKVAKAWFQDALKLDPTNVGLKRLVALADSPQQSNQRGRPDAKGASAPPSKTTPALKTGTQLQLPDPNESLRIMFPGLKAMEEKEALDYLFGLDPYPSASKSGKTK